MQHVQATLMGAPSLFRGLVVHDVFPTVRT
jgi:hypothetical protein